MARQFRLPLVRAQLIVRHHLMTRGLGHAFGRNLRFMRSRMARRRCLRFGCAGARSAARFIRTLPVSALARLRPSPARGLRTTRWTRRLTLDFLLGAYRRNKTFDRQARNFTFEQALDGIQVFNFFAIDQRYRGARTARAPGAADAVHVVFRHIRQFEIHHMR